MIVTTMFVRREATATTPMKGISQSAVGIGTTKRRIENGLGAGASATRVARRRSSRGTGSGASKGIGATEEDSNGEDIMIYLKRSEKTLLSMGGAARNMSLLFYCWCSSVRRGGSAGEQQRQQLTERAEVIREVMERSRARSSSVKSATLSKPPGIVLVPSSPLAVKRRTVNNSARCLPVLKAS